MEEKFTDKVRKERERILDLLDAAHNIPASSLPFDTLRADLSNTDTGKDYRKLSSIAEAHLDRLEPSRAPEITSLYYQLLLVDLILYRAQTPVPYRLAPSIRQLNQLWFEHVLTGLEENPPEFYSAENDQYLKDLGVCSGKMFFAGAEVVDTTSLSRSFLYASGAWDTVRAIAYFSRKLSFRTRRFYQMHVDDRYLKLFNPQGWYLCLMRVAQMLTLNPTIGGISGSTWFVDPAVGEITPRLNYARERLVANGAALFRLQSKQEDVDLATRTSTTRRRLYESGHYLPCSHLLVWRRKEVLAWAHQQYSRGIVAEEDLLLPENKKAIF